MSFFAKAIVGFLAAVIGSMGMGGGGVLLLYLSSFSEISQLKAQGINLLFFLPVGAVSVLLHIKNSLIKKKTALFTILTAAPFSFVGAVVSGAVNQSLLRKALGIFLLVLGIREIIGSFKKKEKRT